MVHHAEQMAIEVSQVEKSFNGETIVYPTNLIIAIGETALMTGQSGSGKSTLLRMIAGIETPDHGDITVMGQELCRLSDKKRSEFVRKTVGVGFQTPNLDTGLTVAQNIVGLTAVTKGKVNFHHAGQLSEQFGVSHLLDRSAATLSGGEKLRVALARLYMTYPSVVLLDEPTNMIDPSGKKAVFEAIAELGADKTTLMISHDEQAAEYVTRQIHFDSGSITADTNNI